MMSEKEIFEIMINEYKEACHDFYETRYGEKLDVKYTIKNRHTGKIINGSASGAGMDRKAEEVMRTIGRMMIAIYGCQVGDTLKGIREEIRAEEKEFFESRPDLIIYVTAID